VLRVGFNEDEIERFRRRLEHQGDFPKYRPDVPYFGGVRGMKAWAQAIVVDFALSRTGDPVILIYYHGFVTEFFPTKELSQAGTEIEISEKPHHRIARWFGERLKNERLSMSGVTEVKKSVALKWDFTSCDIVKNLKYAAELANRLGIKRVAVVTEPGLTFNFPAVVGDSVKVKVLPTYRTKAERELAFALLRQYLTSKGIRLQERSELLNRIKSVIALPESNGYTPGEAHPSVGALISLALGLKLDESGQLYFPEDVS
jgi:hypothetical protein